MSAVVALVKWERERESAHSSLVCVCVCVCGIHLLHCLFHTRITHLFFTWCILLNAIVWVCSRKWVRESGMKRVSEASTFTLCMWLTQLCWKQVVSDGNSKMRVKVYINKFDDNMMMCLMCILWLEYKWQFCIKNSAAFLTQRWFALSWT